MKKFICTVRYLISCFIISKTKRRAFRNQPLENQETEYQKNRRLYNIDRNSYISLPFIIDKDTKIGKFCSIAQGVKLGLSFHPLDRLSTHCFTCSKDIEGNYQEIIIPDENIIPWKTTKPITIENDVWIGLGAIIKDGITIHNGAVIGAGAVVTKDVPPYAIVAGVPAKIIKYRFSKPIIDKLLELEWWNYPEEFIANNLPFDNVEKCIEILEKNKNLRQIDETVIEGENSLVY